MRRGDARCFDLCLGYPSERYSVFTLKLDGGDGADYAGHDDPKQQISHDKISLKKYGRALVAGAAGPSCVALRRAAGFRAKPGKTVLHAVACGLIRAIGSIFHNGIGLRAAMAAGLGERTVLVNRNWEGWSPGDTHLKNACRVTDRGVHIAYNHPAKAISS